ncbi:uncharacterized protein LOC125525808 [Triticum urartu]|nr:uncharacterized protein LOC125525808 [Triticum urartu]
MAEFALGLTKTAVEGTVSRVKSAIDEEVKLKVQVQNDLVFITGEFEMMQSFLNVANKERAKNEVVRTWVRQIRDLAFDVEDCVELVVSLDSKSGSWSWMWRVLPDCMAPPRSLDQAVTEIQQLKARVEDVSHRNTRYNLIGDSSSNSKTSAPAPDLTRNAGPSSSRFHILREVWEAAGKMRHDMGDLRKLINSQENVLEVISLWGGPGTAADLGATHVIQEAYNDPKICQEFKSRAWVKLAHPFNPDDFLNNLLTQFYASSHRAKLLGAEFQRKMRAVLGTKDDLRKAQLMKQVIYEQRYLVVVEHLSTVGQWDTIRMYLPDSGNGSRIVVTTHQLGLAIACMGNPYQVSELRQLSYGQSLCAFFSKVSGRRSDMGELIWQLKCGGVISVWGCTRDETTLVYKVYTAIAHKSKEFEGVEFKRHIWVDVPNPFNLGIFSQRLFFNFHSDDLRSKEIKSAGTTGGTSLIERCRNFLCEDDCLVVINGLSSTDDWGLIKAAFFPEPASGCIIAITEEESVATHSAVKADRVLNIKDLDDDLLLRKSIKGCDYHGIGAKEASKRGHFFSNRREEARDWMDKFGSVVDRTGFYCAEHRFNVSSLRGIDDTEKLAIAKKLYYDQMPDVGEGDVRPRHTRFPFTKFSWVNVPDPFDLTDFCWRLLLDFHSDNLEAKQTVAVDMMEGLKDPFQGCLDLLREQECFVVIEGVRSRDDWNQIKSALFSHRRQGHIKPSALRRILVITKDKSVDLGDGVSYIDGPNYDLPADPPLTKKPGYSDQDMSRAFSSRMIEACDWIKKFRLIGHHQNILWNKLLDKRQGVISVWGIAGIGKSYLVRRFYHTSMTGSYRGLSRAERIDFLRLDSIVTKYAWVDVPYPFNLTDLCSLLILDFHSDDLEAKEIAAVGMMQGQDPIQVCHEFLHQHKCLVVIDGLRSNDDWDLIEDALLSEPLKGYILVVTNEESIARHCVVDTEKDVVNVKGLSADWALDVFSKAMCYPMAGKEIANWKESISTQQLSNLITKCGGLPQVLTAIGEYCREYQHIRKCGLETVNAADFMGMLETDPKFHNLRGLFDWMQSYFVACPDSLKPCIFYLSVFPLGYDIRKSRLLRRWIAEGYSRDTLGSTAEENGEKFISELVKLSIIQQKHSPSMEDLCQVNGFFREYIFSRPMQDNLVFALEGRCIPNTQRAGQHLTISRCWDRDKILFESMELSRLRSLTVFGDWRSFFISPDVKMKYLRVLDLEDTSGVTNGDIEQIGNLLPHLKFLSLRGCQYITRLPASLGGLRQLQTLDIKGTRIVTLSATIIKLKKLQYVRAGPPLDSDVASTSQRPAAAATPPAVDGDGDGAGVSTSQPTPTAAADVDEARTSAARRSGPRGGLVFSWLSKLNRHGHVSSAHDGVQFPVAAAWGIGKLTALHTLGVVNVSNVGGKVVLRELKKITQLRKLKLSGINRKNWQDFCYTISGHGYLESLSVRLDHDEQQDHLCNLDDISKPPKTLKSLKLYRGNVHVSPVWMKQLDGLKKVDVEDLELTISEQVDIDSLKDLRCKDKYRHLCVKPIEDGDLHYGWREEDWIGGGFGDATVLKINCGSYRSEIAFGQWITRTVESLVVHCSTTESSLELSGLENLCRLKEVWLTGSYNEAIKQDLQQKLADHANEPVLHFEDQSECMCMPSIYFCS